MKNIPSLVGRKPERHVLEGLIESRKAEFLAVYGRHRVGKTYLIRQSFSVGVRYIEAVGKKNGSYAEQIQIFFDALLTGFKDLSVSIERPTTWDGAFKTLEFFLEKIDKKRKVVIFLDELPWLATPRSDLLSSLDHHWNAHLSKHTNLILVVCGSAATWILKNIINNKGGLHNRLTAIMRLMPFSIEETREFLLAQGIHLHCSEIIEVYMALGGVPYYLSLARKGKSAAQIINEVCFQESSPLWNEFDNLYSSLFDDSEAHISIVKHLSKAWKGCSRSELLNKLKIKSGGTFNRAITELEAAGFVTKYIPMNRSAKDQFFRLTDEFSMFYLRWISDAKKKNFHLRDQYWQLLAQKQAWLSWAGTAFEYLIQKNIHLLIEGLGIQGVHCNVRTWRKSGKPESDGAQVDIVIERADRIIDLCEVKFVHAPFIVSKAMASAIKKREAVFKEATKTKLRVKNVLVTVHPPLANEWLNQTFENVVVISDILERH